MDKRILAQYIDACELIHETEREIRRLESLKGRGAVSDSVKASNPEFPYQPMTVHIEGVGTEASKRELRLHLKRQALEDQKENADQIRVAVEMWLPSVPLRMQRIIRARVFNGLTWEETARQMGRRATGESLRKEFERFMTEEN